MPRPWKVWSVSLSLFAVLSPMLSAGEAPSLDARAATVISLNSRVIDTTRPEPVLSEALKVRPEDVLEDEILLVKFPGPVTARQIEALQAESLRVYTYLPYYTYLVKMPVGRAKASLPKIGATWTGAYHPAYKMSPAISEMVGGDLKAETAKGDFRPVMIQILPDANLGEVIQRLKDLGVKGIAGSGRGRLFSRVRLLLTPSEIAALREELAGLRDVFWIDLEARRALLNDTTVWVGQSGLSRRADDADLQPGDLRRGADRGHPRHRHRPRHVLVPRHLARACRRPTPATAARWSTPASAR